ncbi:MULTISPECIES: hypothetical protein [unclassified Streptomyces]|uniref:hypothetical protein n=1 Tax=unclassified Streptomyces TaxID=2593676 RepID=UPI000CD5A683|nr:MULTISPECIES: hypothetical protein [unclassified Streptomyces]AWL40627.1 hypothetical protein B9S64_22895 [Streptomyces sp. SM18]
MSDTDISRPTRRHVLTAGSVIAAGSVLWTPGTAVASPPAAFPAASPAAGTTPWTARNSANGWPVLDSAPAHRVEGAARLTVRLAEGDAATVLLYVLRRYCYEIDMLTPEDVTGHLTDRNVRADLESNQLSGTALTVRQVAYPLGAPAGNGMSGPEVTVVEDILADCQGVVAWGGETDPVKQSHFQIDVPPHDSRLKKLVAKINGWEEHPGRGAGAIDAFQPARVSRARKARAER